MGRHLWIVPLVLATAAPSLAQATDKRACSSAYEQAQYARRDRRLRAARAQSLICAQQACGAAAEADCAQWLREIDAAMPTVVFAARDQAGVDLTRVVVSVDGEKLTDTLDGGAIPVDPGAHAFRFEAGGQSVDKTVTINEGEKSRVVSVVISQPGVAPAGTQTRGVSEQAEVTTRGSVAPGLIVGGVGLGLVASSIIVGAIAKSDLDTLRATCAPSCAQSSLDAVQTKAVISDVLLVAGIVGFGAGALMIVFRPTHHGAGASGVGLRGSSLVLYGEF